MEREFILRDCLALYQILKKSSTAAGGYGREGKT